MTTTTNLQTVVNEIYQALAVAFSGYCQVSDVTFGEALRSTKINTKKLEGISDSEIIAAAADLVDKRWGNLQDHCGMTTFQNIQKGYSSFGSEEQIVQEEKIKVGDCATAQFGNPTDRMGYRENVDVIVMSCKDGCFLIHDTVNEIVGIATNSKRNARIKGQLYCTLARSYGEGSIGRRLHGFTTAREAAASIGFIL